MFAVLLSATGTIANPAWGQMPGRSDEAALKRYIQTLPPAPDPNDDSLQVGWADLNGDGRLDAVVRATGRPYCGSGGCNLMVLERTRTSFRVRGSLTISQLPVRLLASGHYGWRDLSMFQAGGGNLPGCTALIEFRRGRYRSDGCWPPEHPGIKATGRVIIARPLLPRE